MKFKFTGESSWKESPYTTSVEAECESLPDVLSYFKQFLEGCGYVIEGEIIVWDKLDE